MSDVKRIMMGLTDAAMEHMADVATILTLFLGCVLCCQSIRDTVDSRSDRQWLSTMQALERDGLWHLGPFELAIPEVRLSDLSHAHTYCGPGCRAMEVGR